MTRSKRKGKRIIKRILQKTKCLTSGKEFINVKTDILNNNIMSQSQYIDSSLFSKPIVKDDNIKRLWEYTKERDCVFFIQPIGETILIHNGHEWIELFIIYDVLFHQFGKYSYTRKRCYYKNKKKKKKMVRMLKK